MTTKKKKGFLDKHSKVLEDAAKGDSDFMRAVFLIVYFIMSLVSFFGFFFVLYYYTLWFSFAISWLNLGRLVALIIIFKVSESIHYLKILLFLFIDLLAFYTIGRLFITSTRQYIETKLYWRKKYEKHKSENGNESSP